MLHTTDSGQAMAFSDRQCRAAGEAAAAGLKIFRQYSREVISINVVYETSMFIFRLVSSNVP